VQGEVKKDEEEEKKNESTEQRKQSCFRTTIVSESFLIDVKEMRKREDGRSKKKQENTNLAARILSTALKDDG
jgi:hypothetical protein